MSTPHGNEDFLKYSILTQIETQWREISDYLELKGYRLRPRYCKNWQPSWELPENEGKHPQCFEDHIALPQKWKTGIDAIQVSTGRLVWIKRCEPNRTERDTLLSCLEVQDQSLNHCIPLLECIEENEDTGVYYLVTPFLRPVHDPPLETLGDAIEFTTHIMEGLEFMHANGTVTRDGEYRHIMMDARALYPDGFHPVKLHLDPTAQREATHLPRGGCTVHYYYTEFQFDELQYRQLPSDWEILRNNGRVYAPELFEKGRPDSYNVDVWDVGQILRTRLYDEYSNVAFLKYVLILTLDWRMDAKLCHSTWRGSRPQNPSAYSLSRRLRPKSETWLQAATLDLVAFFNDVVGIVRKTLVWINERHG
ncbi:hypothetical protein BDY19DRAFT_179850 [Irpex rosettiformis]|uniref:Uncharacterized protein n=1 Tax=Irpex rosettiformis TaxID=378272 RepID=A0ACB8U3A8_9APHY|nr:hypothetical protein BDY19DRAFT_179850 [Irpex rosettiformis]